jgi:hypothetical protein
MKIVAAVIMAIEQGDDSFWYMYTRGGTAHGFHVDYRQCIDGFDAMIFRRLARDEPSIRAGITMSERADGTFKPTLILDPIWLNDRRKGPRKGAEFRRPVQRVVTLQNHDSVNHLILQESESVNQSAPESACEAAE